MKYYKVKEVIKDFTTLSLIVNENEKSILYEKIDNIQYFGVETEDENFLSKQHPECEVVEMNFAEIQPILKECNQMKCINSTVTAMIRQEYSMNDEAKWNTIGILNPANPDFIKFAQYKQKCREYGNEVKKQMGLIQ